MCDRCPVSASTSPSSGTTPPSLDHRLAAVVPAYGSAELLTCGLIRTKKAKTDPDWATNGFSILRFQRASFSKGAQLQFITTRPERLPSSDHQLMVTRSELSVSEALAFLNFRDSFSNPRVRTSTPPIESPGAWMGPEFVGREEHRARTLAGIGESFWLVECWRTGKELEDEIGTDGVSWLCARVRELIAINLDDRRERLGNFLIVMPEYRYRMRVWWPQRVKLGIEVRAIADGSTDFLAMVRASRHGCLISSECRRVASGLHVFDVPEFVDHREIELYDAASGIILDRDAGTPMRSAVLIGHMHQMSVDLNFTFSDGRPPIRAQTMWGTTMRTEAGLGHTSWELELADVLERERRERLREEKRVIVYRGSAQERLDAIEDIRNILRTRIEGYLKIWDPYFGVREAVEFLPFVVDPSTPISVLTSVEPTSAERHVDRSASSTLSKVLEQTRARIKPWLPRSLRRRFTQPVPLRIRKKQQLGVVLKTLRQPGGGVGGLSALKCRVGGGMFHDRFIITHDRAWQLGCSFNQMGEVMSTIVEFPYPGLIEREFNRAWEQIKEEL